MVGRTLASAFFIVIAYQPASTAGLIFGEGVPEDEGKVKILFMHVCLCKI